MRAITITEDENTLRVFEGISEIAAGSLTENERLALARKICAFRELTEEDDSLCQSAYDACAGTIDFLWMAHRISFSQKMDLLDLM